MNSLQLKHSKDDLVNQALSLLDELDTQEKINILEYLQEIVDHDAINQQGINKS